MITEGARWCVQRGYGWPEEGERTEDGGCFAGADVSKISPKAIARGFDQIGTLGSGNHYLEIQVVHPEYVYDAALAQQFGITRPWAAGEPLDPARHALGADVKGVTLHRLQVVQTPKGWEATGSARCLKSMSSQTHSCGCEGIVGWNTSRQLRRRWAGLPPCHAIPRTGPFR